MQKITVLTKDNKEKKLNLNRDELEHLKAEISGFNKSIYEYKTAEGEIITDLDIIKILKFDH